MSKRSASRYWKFQSKFVWLPAAIEATRCDWGVALRVHPSRQPNDKQARPAEILLDPHEAIGFAAWLHEQAEHVVSKKAKASARSEARRAAKPR